MEWLQVKSCGGFGPQVDEKERFFFFDWDNNDGGREGLSKKSIWCNDRQTVDGMSRTNKWIGKVKDNFRPHAFACISRYCHHSSFMSISGGGGGCLLYVVASDNPDILVVLYTCE